MRRAVDAPRVQRFIDEIGHIARAPTRIYLTGGASAVLFGWRMSTIDVDVTIVSEGVDDVLRELPRIKERLNINVELVAPSDFIPELPGWRERSLFIRQAGNATFLHYDFYSQALAKIERGHANDALDVAAMFERGLVESRRMRELFDAIEGDLYRYPAVDIAAFKRALTAVVNRPNRT